MFVGQRCSLAEYQRERATRPSDTDSIGAEAAYEKHFEQRAEAIKRCESLLSTSYATHAEAVAMLAKAKAATSDISKIPRDQIYPTKFPSRDMSPIIYPDNFDDYIASRRYR